VPTHHAECAWVPSRSKVGDQDVVKFVPLPVVGPEDGGRVIGEHQDDVTPVRIVQAQWLRRAEINSFLVISDLPSMPTFFALS
jgi:hypothetical protein